MGDPGQEPSPDARTEESTVNEVSGGVQGSMVQARDIVGPVQQIRSGRNSPSYTAAGNMIVQTLRITPKRVALTLVVVVAVLGAYVLGSNWYRIHTAVSTAESQQDASKIVDNESAPFKAQFLFDPKVPLNWRFVLDRKLTPQEITGLEKLDGNDGQAVWNYLRPLGARLIPRGYQPGIPEDGATETFHMSLLSDRKTTLTVENISVANVTCAPSTAVTLIDFPPEGEAAVDGVAFTLRAPSKPMMAVDDSGIVDHDYFAKHKIDLGAGATPGTLLVTAVGERGMSCSWQFAADYATVDSQSTFTFGDNGKPLTLESPPDHPLQHLQYGPAAPDQSHPWIDCADFHCA